MCNMPWNILQSCTTCHGRNHAILYNLPQKELYSHAYHTTEPSSEVSPHEHSSEVSPHEHSSEVSPHEHSSEVSPHEHSSTYTSKIQDTRATTTQQHALHFKNFFSSFIPPPALSSLPSPSIPTRPLSLPSQWDSKKTEQNKNTKQT